ncbi:hypothetical protein KI387_039305, partial [Taxus chinensis]
AMGDFTRLNTKGIRSTSQIYDFYPQLTLDEGSRHFHRINDAFFVVILYCFDKELYNRRISDESFKEVHEWGAIYLQFPTFTYIWIHGFV